MDLFKDLIGKSMFEIDTDIINSLENINVKVAILEYKYKNCRKRYPINTFKLSDIDYENVISFDELFNFEKIFIIWHFKDIITDLEIFDITSDLDFLKKDYDLILAKILNNEAHNLRAGDTKLLAAQRCGETAFLNNHKVNMREFVLKKYYLQKILNEINR